MRMANRKAKLRDRLQLQWPMSVGLVERDKKERRSRLNNNGRMFGV